MAILDVGLHFEAKEIPGHPEISRWGRMTVSVVMEDYGASDEELQRTFKEWLTHIASAAGESTSRADRLFLAAVPSKPQ